MHGKASVALSIAILILIAPGLALAQGASPESTLIINGQSTRVPVINVNGHSYIGLEAFADAVHGSLSRSGNMVALSVPIDRGSSAPSTTSSAANAPASAQTTPPNPGFSREFLNAGIEEASTLREWHTALTTAIQSGMPLSSGLLEPYRAQATTNLRIASLAATTPSDHSAYQLLNNLFQNMAKLAEKYLKMRASLSYISPDALEKDDLNQHIITCGHSLGAMAASGQFTDDGTCSLSL
jgi:hypothetical protein